MPSRLSLGLSRPLLIIRKKGTVVGIRNIVSATKVKELRGITGAPMIDCKKALEDSDVNEDIHKAIDWLRKKGIARASNKSNERIVTEGLIGVFKHPDNNSMAIVEVNSETDFVARNQHFQDFVARLAVSVGSVIPNNKQGIMLETDLLLARPLAEISGDKPSTSTSTSSTTIQEGLGELVSRIRYIYHDIYLLIQQ